jgi:hypothetical protein
MRTNPQYGRGRSEVHGTDLCMEPFEGTIVRDYTIHNSLPSGGNRLPSVGDHGDSQQASSRGLLYYMC